MGWDVKYHNNSHVTLFQENKMITFSKKKIQNALFLGPFDTNTSKNEISAKRITSIL